MWRQMDTPILEFVLEELDARKGTWPAISKAMEPNAWQSYYSWLTKLAQGRIPDPGVNKIQALADYLRGVSRKRAAQIESRVPRPVGV